MEFSSRIFLLDFFLKRFPLSMKNFVFINMCTKIQMQLQKRFCGLNRGQIVCFFFFYKFLTFLFFVQDLYTFTSSTSRTDDTPKWGKGFWDNLETSKLRKECSQVAPNLMICNKLVSKDYTTYISWADSFPSGSSLCTLSYVNFWSHFPPRPKKSFLCTVQWCTGFFGSSFL